MYLSKYGSLGVNKPGPPLKGTLGRSSVRSLMANWEGRPPVQPRSKLPVPTPNSATASVSTASDQTESTSPIVRGGGQFPARKDSDSSSRGRMGSPSGKSHDSSDSEHNSWSRQPQVWAKLSAFEKKSTIRTLKTKNFNICVTSVIENQPYGLSATIFCFKK